MSTPKVPLILFFFLMLVSYLLAESGLSKSCHISSAASSEASYRFPQRAVKPGEQAFAFLAPFLCLGQPGLIHPQT